MSLGDGHGERQDPKEHHRLWSPFGVQKKLGVEMLIPTASWGGGDEHHTTLLPLRRTSAE